MKKHGRFVIIVLIFIQYINYQAFGQIAHPHIVVKQEEKSAILEKIKSRSWAGSIYGNIERNVTPYVERHKNDPEWILSRYLMNRVPGKRYTRAFSDPNGTSLTGWAGDAPVPTVRVSPHKRAPVTVAGGNYRRPAIEDLVPYDTSRLMNLLNLETNKIDRIDPQAFVGVINGEINDMALDAAIIYWLKGDDSYAKFSADILDQWAKGAYYQEPIIGPCRTGYLDMQTLGDGNLRSVILAYDFVWPYMKSKGYDLSFYETVFEKIASTLAFRGFYNSNWYAAESSAMVFAALSLENSSKRNYYLQFFLDKDTINGSCGQLALPSTVEKWLTPDGHWKEPGGYHNFPVSNLLIASLALENNGYDVFRRFPALFRASFAMLKYSFANLTVSAFGDTGRASQSPQSLEIGIIGAVKYKQPELSEMIASMNKLIEGGKYNRESSGWIGLLCFLPDLPDIKSEYTWPRSGTLEFAKLFLQRNGTDPRYGLMYGVQGASYNHNHCNGMAMELYGMGEVMGIDAGTGPTYDHPLHTNYFSQWAAHNTVIAAGTSHSVPPSGSAGQKNIGQIELASMEPMPDKKEVSADYSFTDTRYLEKSTNTSQKRTMVLVRTSEKRGYYVDIYRSDNRSSNDYVYHNIGDNVLFLNSARVPLTTDTTHYPLAARDYPGLRYFTGVRKLSKWTENLIVLFPAKSESSEEINMQVLMPGQRGREYYQAWSPKAKTSGRQYSGKALPLFTMRDAGESQSRPFIAVFEPFGNKNNYNVQSISVEQRKDGAEFTALTVNNKDNSQQIILQSVIPGKSFTSGECTLRGYLGIAGLYDGKLSSLYLGSGNELRFRNYSLQVKDSFGAASFTIQGNNLIVSCNQETEIGLPFTNISKIVLFNGSTENEIQTTPSPKGVTFKVPAVLRGELRITFNSSVAAEKNGRISKKLMM